VGFLEPKGATGAAFPLEDLFAEAILKGKANFGRV
jgi:hypothetical protein